MARKSAQVRDVQKALIKTTEKGVKRLVHHLTFGLRDATPKKTTFHSIQWIPSIGKFHVGTIGTYEDALAGTVKRQPQISAVATVKRSFKLGRRQRVNVVNNGPAIESLNRGSSTQAGAGFVQRVMKDSIKKAEKEVSD